MIALGISGAIRCEKILVSLVRVWLFEQGKTRYVQHQRTLWWRYFTNGFIRYLQPHLTLTVSVLPTT